MSTRIDLFFSRYLDIDLLEKGITFWTTRTKAQIKLKTEGGWTRAFEAIIDIGSPISVIPRRIWEGIERRIIGEDTMRGIVPKEESYLPVKIAEVTCFLIDRERRTDPIPFRSYLVARDDVPLILGMDSLLAVSVLHIDYPKQEGYVEI